MTYNPRSVFQSYEQYGRAKTKQAKASKSKNANQQAARTMRSAGIGGLGGRPTTSSAKQIQDRFRRETQRDSGSTYDEVPQTITTGLGSRKTQTSKDDDMSMGTKIDRAFVKVMTSLIPDFSPPKEQAVFPLQVYGGPLFTVPTPTPVDMQELDDAARDTARTFAPPSMDAPTLPTTTIDSDVGVTTPKGLMSPPTMEQPEAPEGLMGIPRALARANAVPTAAYQVQSGDTLSEIAAATGTTVKELADLNQISDVDLIETGADIQIPIKRLEDEAVVTQATSMEELEPIKASYTIAGAVGAGLMKKPKVKFNYKNTSQRLVDDLMQDFGLTKVQAAAMAGNLAQETGEFKFLQEKKPTVKGSRGGYGFAQWTGPRRKAYEKWAEENGLDINTYEANYGYLKEELENRQKGTIESMGIKTIKNLKTMDDIEEATQYISEYFLRPGIPHMPKRKEYAKEILEMAD